jgi:threonylcarbamoyladenosine tRNA methylthiotransferase MtaB
LCGQLHELRPGIALGADFIAGFPTETDEMFENTRAAIAECGLTWLHVFPFSARPDTPASRMPLVAPAAIKARAKRLRDEGEAAAARFLATRVGSKARILVERDGFGHSEHFAPVQVAGAAAGEIVAARITGTSGAELIGEAQA